MTNNNLPIDPLSPGTLTSRLTSTLLENHPELDPTSPSSNEAVSNIALAIITSKRPKVREPIKSIHAKTTPEQQGVSITLERAGTGHFSRAKRKLRFDFCDGQSTRFVEKKGDPKSLGREWDIAQLLANISIEDKKHLVLPIKRVADSNAQTIGLQLPEFQADFSNVKTKNALKMFTIWYADIAQGLITLHNNGILHRDLHPGNFLVKDHAAICDFGQSGTDSNENIKLKTDLLPPEFFNDDGKRKRVPFEKTSDIWAFGKSLQQNIENQIHIELNKKFGLALARIENEESLKANVQSLTDNSAAEGLINCYQKLVEVVLLCKQTEKEKRPSAVEVYNQLSEITPPERLDRKIESTTVKVPSGSYEEAFECDLSSDSESGST
ncbi:MAG: protein kinase [Chlamydiia bacterium]|nr:protein kinase [Chlamydiia bacterium]MCP5491617.1 protein kinase [Chlamydiales bacterium]